MKVAEFSDLSFCSDLQIEPLQTDEDELLTESTESGVTIQAFGPYVVPSSW